MLSCLLLKPTPQQTDGSSCGAIVARNAAVRMRGSVVGNWEDKIDGVAVRKELVDMLQSAVRQGLRKVELTR